jgi:hypothetical protein
LYELVETSANQVTTPALVVFSIFLLLSDIFGAQGAVRTSVTLAGQDTNPNRSRAHDHS